MSRKLFLLCVLLLLSIQIAFSQALKNDKKDEELKKEAVIFLRETAMEVGNLRTLENRISFSAEIANLMWFQDAGEAQTMFQKVIVDFRQLLMQIDQQFTALENAPNNEDANYDLLTDDTPDAKRKLTRKLTKAVSVRQQIALSIAEHDPQMAFDFFTGTSQAVTNAQLRTQFEANDAYFESKLIYAIADKDVDKALEGGRRRLAKGFDFEIINLLKKIYEKDAAKGITFGEEIVSKLKSESSKSINFYLISTLIGAGEDNLAKIKDKTGKKPMFNEQSMRELADLLAAEIMKLDDSELPRLTSYIAQVEKFSPSRAVQIRAKFGAKNNTNRGEVKTVVGDYDEPPMIEKPPNKSNNAAKQEDYFKQVQTLSAKPLSKEEKEKVVAQSREIIAKIKSREQKVVALSFLASQVSLAGDKDLANEIMNEARGLVNFQPKSYKDYLLIWMLTSGYVAADAERAFPLLEDTIARLNEMIAAFIKVGEFMDVNEDIIEGEEVQVGNFGGSMTREMLGGLGGAANPTLIALARTDFARTKTLTEKFERLEVRILAKMLVLRAILGDKKISEK
jgi:hypothetical protein